MVTTSPREDRPTAAVLIMASAIFLFTLVDTSAKWLIMAGLPAMQVVFSRYVGAFLTALIFFFPRRGLGEFRSNRPWIQVLRALALLGSTVFNFLALRYLPITLTIAMFFAMPIVVTLLSIPILGERVGLRRFLAVLTGFIGVLVIVQPWGALFHWAVFLSILHRYKCISQAGYELKWPLVRRSILPFSPDASSARLPIIILLQLTCSMK